MKNKKDMHEHEMNENVDSNDFSTGEAGEFSNENEPKTANDSEAVNEEVSKLKSDLDEQKDKYVRLFAEFDNYRRRTSKEHVELRQTAGVEIITSLLDVLDDMDRAENQLQESDAEKTLKEGLALVFNKFRKILKAKGLKPIETLHSDFDVEKDEAISEIEVDKKMKGKVVAEVQKGYLLNDKLIRFAKVVVGK